MYSTSGYSRKHVAITACCLALLLFAGERSLGQVLQGDAAIPASVRPQVPDGFPAELVTSDVHKPRVMRVAPNGDLFVADSMFNAVHVLRFPAGSAKTGSAKPTKHAVFARGLKQPFGIAFYPPGPNPQWVYIADTDGVVRFRYKNGDLKATGKPERIFGGIPSAHHYARGIVFSPDGSQLYLSVGSGLKIVATGLCNCEGMAIQPVTGQLWCIVNERDELGDNTPIEYATHVVDSAFLSQRRFALIKLDMSYIKQAVPSNNI